MRKRKLWLGKREVVKLLGVGAIIGLHWLCLFGGVKIANVSIALAGLATMSLFTAFAEPLFTSEPLPSSSQISSTLCYKNAFPERVECES